MPGEARNLEGIPELLDDCEVVPKALEECLDRLKVFTCPTVELSDWHWG